MIGSTIFSTIDNLSPISKSSKRGSNNFICKVVSLGFDVSNTIFTAVIFLSYPKFNIKSLK